MDIKDSSSSKQHGIRQHQVACIKTHPDLECLNVNCDESPSNTFHQTLGISLYKITFYQAFDISMISLIWK